MSAVGDARQRLLGAGWATDAVQFVLRAALLAAVLMLAGIGLLAWRLAEGPLEVSWFARSIEALVFAPGAPTRLAIGRATIAWNGYREGAEGGLELRVYDLHLVDRTGASDAALAEADVTLSLQRLLALQVTPRFVALSGLRLSAMRREDGTLSLDLGALGGSGDADGNGLDLQELLSELKHPAGTGSSGGMAQLREVRVHDARLRLDDRQLGATVRAEVDDLDFTRQARGGFKGGGSGRLGLGDATASVSASADLLADGGTHLGLQLAPMPASALARSDPTLAPLGALNADLQGKGSLDLSATLEPRTGSMKLSAGSGQLSLRGGTVAFDRLLFSADANWSGTSWRPDGVTLQRAEAVLSIPGGAPTTVTATGSATRANGSVAGQADISIDHLRFADVPALWPATWGGHVRPWLAENVTGGTAHDGAIRLTLSAPETDLSDLTLTGASGTLAGDDVTINWLRPVPPVEHAQALLRVTGPDVIEIAVPTATQGPIAIRDGLIRFTGLTAKDQFMALTLSVQGQVPDVIQLLKHPRLRLLDKHPLPIKASSGMATGKLSVDMPMKKELDFDMVRIGAQVRTKDMRLAGLVAGRDLEHADAQIDVTSDGLKAQGQASVANIAGTLGVEMDFRAGPPSQVLQHVTFAGKATPAQLAEAALDKSGIITAGQAGVGASYTALRNGSAQVAAKVDLTDAAVALLGWRKKQGAAAFVAGTVLLQDDKLTGVKEIAAHGPGLEIAAEVEAVDGRPLLLRLRKAAIGPTQASGEVRFPERAGAPIQARLSGPMLDVSRELSSSEGGGSAGGEAGESGSPWIADVRFDRVVLGKKGALSGVSAHAEDDGRRLRVLRASSAAPAVEATVTPSGVGRRVTMRAADGGALLRELDVIDSVHGGTLALDAEYDDRYADPPLAGTLDMSGFGVRDAVVLGKLLQAITIYGIFDAIRGEGVQFSRLIMPFRYGGDVLSIGESRAYSASLGLTVRGTVDLGRKSIDLRGTVVPAYAVNSALGRIPLIGKLFSAERGGGLVAVEYGVAGRLSDPSISVNPLSALTPGFLRGLFSGFK